MSAKRSQGERDAAMKPLGLVAYRAVSDAIGKAAFLIITVLAARRLSPEEFGVFAIGTTVGWIAVVASDFGLQLHLARAVSATPAAALHLLRRWLGVRVAAALGALVVVSIGLSVVGSGATALPIALFALGYLAAGVVEFLHHFYRGLSRTDIESTLTISLRLATLAAASLVLWLRPEPTVLAVSMLAAPLLMAAYSVRLAFQLASSMSPQRVDVPQDRLAEFAREIAPIGAGILLSALYFRIDVFLLQAWQGIETVGLYNAVFRLIEAARLFPAAALAVALPMLVRAGHAATVIRLSSALTAFGVVFAAAVWATSDFLVHLLYGPGYAEAVPAFRILAASFPLMSLNYALTHQLIAWNGQRAYAVLCLEALGFNVALNAYLIPSLSLAGAAWATLWTEALLTVGCLGALIVLSRTRSKTEAASAPAMATV
jgi:O-antigen/teichoic acid export membrane protein